MSEQSVSQLAQGTPGHMLTLAKMWNAYAEVCAAIEVHLAYQLAVEGMLSVHNSDCSHG
jgi:hypothetical protein